ncbi:MAG TPA: hypothetical protein VMZ30_14775 [Pyrinomonadaceae bacterium]|nr:hypothetical protein [Pyrinomonadaceae bacterium]
MKFRLILPIVFLIVLVLFVGVAMMGAGGHGPNPFDFILYFAYPICFLTSMLESTLGGPDLLWLSLCLVLAVTQYFLIGYFVDKLLQQRTAGR